MPTRTSALEHTFSKAVLRLGAKRRRRLAWLGGRRRRRRRRRGGGRRGRRRQRARWGQWGRRARRGRGRDAGLVCGPGSTSHQLVAAGQMPLTQPPAWATGSVPRRPPGALTLRRHSRGVGEQLVVGQRREEGAVHLARSENGPVGEGDAVGAVAALVAALRKGRGHHLVTGGHDRPVAVVVPRLSDAGDCRERGEAAL